MMFDAGLDDAEDLSRRAARWEELGHPERAAADYRASLARRPDSVSTACDLAWFLLYGRGRSDPDEAVRWARRAIELDPGSDLAHLILGRALYEAGRYAEAADELEANIQREPSTAGDDWLRLADSRYRLGRPLEAAAAFHRALSLLEQLPALKPIDHYDLGCVHANLASIAALPGSGMTAAEGLAEADRAMQWLHRAVARGYRNVALMRRDHDLDPLRSRPDFQLLMMDLEFPDDPLARGD
jgi:tetratricopeptide (TPR) repeat protein